MIERLLKSLFIVAALAVLAGCQTDSPIDDLLQGRQIDYEQDENQKQQSLQYPPDLLSTARGVEGTVSLSEYTIGSVPTINEQTEVAVDAPDGVKVSYRRNGNLRWVETGLVPNDSWGPVLGFWKNHLGFDISKENAELGVVETEWLDLRERVATPGWFGEYIDQTLNRLNDSGERDKFMTRLERNENGGTDIYIAHRHIVARFNDDGQFTGYESQPSDLQLEIEMMRRMMLYLAKRDLDDSGDAVADAESGEDGIDTQIADVEADETSQYRHEGVNLYISKPFHESWQLVQVGLNRGGFSIEDRDYQEGIIYIRHSGGPDSDKIFGKAETNFFNRLFGEQRPILRDIKLIFHHNESNSVRLTTEAVEGDDPLTDLQSEVVLELLHQYLP